MESRLRVGIIGLGRAWPRYRRALGQTSPPFEVVAVADAAAVRAEEEARRLGLSAAAESVTELLEREDVDAVLLGRAWWRLWPLGQALRAGKPTFCTPSLAEDEENADALLEQARTGEGRVLMAPPPGLAVLLDRLTELQKGPLGPARLVRLDWSVPLSSPAVLPLLQGCAQLLGSAPVAVRATGAEGAPGFASVVLEASDGRVAQLTLWAGAGACRVEVVGERGTATAERPRRLCWHDGDGRHTLGPPAGAGERNLLERFAQALRSGARPQPGIEEAHAALGWLRAARASLAEGRRVVLSGQ